MTKRQRELHIEEIKSVLFRNGWVMDSYGHFKRDNFRIKMQKTSMRYECKKGAGWVNLRSDYFKNVKIIENFIVLKGAMF